MKFRGLRADEIDIRVGGKSGADKTYFLLYKDARCDMNILDETVGPENWQRRHYECKGNLYCSVGIRPNAALDDWVFKDDCGTESQTEKEKGESSDSFKRACVNWGIGRELYTAPNIKIDNSKLKWSEGNKYLYTKLRVKDIEYSEENGAREIIRLAISDENGNDLFMYGYERTTKAQKAKENPVCCEFCGNPIEKVIGTDGSYVSVQEIVKTSKAKTKEFCGKEHILCAEHLKDKKVITALWEKDNGQQK